MLYVIKGVSGSGKSTFAKTLAESLGIYHYEADTYHINKDGVYNWKRDNLHKAHEWCQGMVEMELMDGNDVIVSNTTTTEKEMKTYTDLAEKYGHCITSLVVEKYHAGNNSHDVPEHIINAQEQKLLKSLKLK